MENTLINKQAFFALYWGQEVIKEHNGYKFKVLGDTIYWDDALLELKPLSEISDEDALEVGKIIGNVFTTQDIELIEMGKWKLKNNVHLENVRISDYLRSKGYALPYMDLSVEQMVEFGWIKLSK